MLNLTSYRGRTAWLSTKHQKHALIAPSLEQHAGIHVETIEVDTDQLGTFTGERPRAGTQLETAIAKAKLGLELTGETLGVASEGSIGPDPQNPFLVSNIETLVLVDLERDLVIHESHRSFEIVAKSHHVGPESELNEFLESIDFPNQGVIARVENRPDLEIVKGIQSHKQLERVIELLSSADRTVLLETDFRAHQSPSRRKNIEVAAKKLAIRLAENCPKCQIPGFGRIEFKTGLECQSCGLANSDALAAEILSCVACDYTQPGKVIAESLSPERCGWCNP